MAVPSTWSLYQFGDPTRPPTYFCFRPAVDPPLQLPAALVEPVFARFLDRVGGPLASVGDCGAASTCASRLVSTMSLYYKVEAARQAAVLAVLAQFLGRSVSGFTFSGAQPDSSTRVGALSFTHSSSETALY